MRRWLFLTVLLAGLVAAQQTFPFTWGAYRIELEQNVGDAGLESQRLLAVRDGEESALADDYLINVYLAEITGRPPEELVVRAYSGGAHCCNTISVFSQDEGELVTLTTGSWGSGGLDALRDSDGDGRAELTMVRIYEYVDGQCFACSPSLWRTFVWQNGLFVDATRRYPEPTEKAAREARRALEEAGPGSDDFYLKQQAAEYWVNAFALGRGEEAWDWLEANLPGPVMEWLRRNRVLFLRPFSALP